MSESAGSGGPTRAERRGGPIDPRLFGYTNGSRRFLALSVALGAVTALLVVGQAWCIAEVVSGAVVSGKSARVLAIPLAVLLAVVVGRALVGWATERAAQLASTRAKSICATPWWPRWRPWVRRGSTG